MRNAIQLEFPPTLQQQQLAFTAAIRDPLKAVAMTGVNSERMALYHELFYNNFTETLASAFPVLRRVLDTTRWQQLCQQFFEQHACSTPYLARMPGEFVEFLQQLKSHHPLWLPELALWEWSELEMLLAPDPLLPSDINHDVLHGIPLLSPLVRAHVFDFAVHKISNDYLPEQPDGQKNYLVVWRKLDDVISFMQVNAFSYRLLQLLKENAQHTGHELLSRIADEQSDYDPLVMITGGTQTLRTFFLKNILLGALPL